MVDTEGICRSGDLCTRYVKADLPLLDLSSKAGLDSVLGIGIALIALALLLMCIMAIILIRMRKKTGKRRGKKGYVPSFHPMHMMMLTCTKQRTSDTVYGFGSCQWPSSSSICTGVALCGDSVRGHLRGLLCMQEGASEPGVQCPKREGGWDDHEPGSERS